MTTIQELRSIYDEHMRRNVDFPGTVREEFPTLVRYSFQMEKPVYTILYSKLSAEDVDMAIKAQVSHARLQGADLEWKYFDYDTPDDLKAHLIANDFAPEDEEAVMLLPIADAPEKLKAPVNHDIRRVTDVEQLKDADRVVYEVWKDDRFFDGVQAQVSQYVLPMWEADPESTAVYVAYVDNQPVSYGRVDFARNNPFASIWGGSTLPEFRGRGIYTALIASRLQEAQKRGYHYLTVDANPHTSMPILQKLGFVTIAYTRAFNLQAG